MSISRSASSVARRLPCERTSISAPAIERSDGDRWQQCGDDSVCASGATTWAALPHRSDEGEAGTEKDLVARALQA